MFQHHKISPAEMIITAIRADSVKRSMRMGRVRLSANALIIKMPLATWPLIIWPKPGTYQDSHTCLCFSYLDITMTYDGAIIKILFFYSEVQKRLEAIFGRTAFPIKALVCFGLLYPTEQNMPFDGS